MNKKFSNRIKTTNTIKKVISSGFDALGYEIRKKGTFDRLQNYDPKFLDLINDFDYTPFTMLHRDNLYALYQSILHVERNGVMGDIVECGVWRGGAMMFAANVLKYIGNTNRRIWLFDTFEGMPEPSDIDESVNGNSASKIYNELEKAESYVDWCYADITDVKQNISSTNYPTQNIEFIKGNVLNTLPNSNLKNIAILRLDTDWYDSTKHELEQLYPLLSKNGVLIIDDYGTWLGARKASDEYFAGQPVFLNRVDHTAVLAIKY